MMARVLRHLPLLLCIAVAMCISSCGDEPHPRHYDGPDTPTDTTQHPTDTTGGTPADTTSHNSDTTIFSIALTAARDYGYMGQTLQLQADTTGGTGEAIKWTSSRGDVATVDAQGLVTFANVRQDGQTVISATSQGHTATLTLHCRQWLVAALDSSGWRADETITVYRGDTVTLTIVNSTLNPINDNGFNAAACQWKHSSRDADIALVITQVMAPEAANGWTARYVVSPTAPTGAIVNVMASLGEAAATASLLIRDR